MSYWNLVGTRASGRGISGVSAAVLVATAAMPVLVIALLVPPPQVLPVFGTVSIVAAGLVGLFAFCSGAAREGNHITAWDLAGACAFIGFAAGMLSEPEQVVQLLGLATTAP